MPTATEFTALGAGNGFPFCLTKVDVSGYDYWTTLSGWSKVSTPADDTASIADSMKNAMALYWNFDGLTYNATQTKNAVVAGVPYSATATITEYSSNGSILEVQPKDRVCGSTPIDFGIFDSDTAVDPPTGQPKVAARVDFSSVPIFGSQICLMYNGATTSEENFVGYGFGQFYDFQLSAFVGSNIFVRSFSNSGSSDIDYYAMPTNISGISMSFVCGASGDTKLPSTGSASSTYPDSTGSDSVEFIRMQLYTYP